MPTTPSLEHATASDLSPAETRRYQRQLSLPDFGTSGQRRLKAASVLVVGTGGLGSPLLTYLAAAGVGRIGLVDFDRVEASNLHRQTLFTDADEGRPKVAVARERLQALNPLVDVQAYDEPLSRENALELIRDYDLVADGTDNFRTRYLVNDACVLLDKPNVYASIFRFEGQVSVFHALLSGGRRGPNYRDLFPSPPPPGSVPDCAEGGVLGVLPGILGCLQANEVIKLLTGLGEPLIGRLLLVDALSMRFREFKFQPDPANPLTGRHPSIRELVDYDEFCDPTPSFSTDMNNPIQEISVQQLKQWMDEGKDFQLIDVREPHEADIATLNGELIPLDQLAQRRNDIDDEKPVVLHCRSGKRSAAAIQLLADSHDPSQLYNLKGGINAWAEEIDPQMEVY